MGESLTVSEGYARCPDLLSQQVEYPDMRNQAKALSQGESSSESLEELRQRPEGLVTLGAVNKASESLEASQE